MRTFITFQNKRIPVFYTRLSKQTSLQRLAETLESKYKNGKRAIVKCLSSLISIEIVGCEAILHSKYEQDSLALSLY